MPCLCCCSLTVIDYVYGCQKIFGNQSPAWCNIMCCFACETPQLRNYSLRVATSRRRESFWPSIRLEEDVLIQCNLEMIQIETQGLDADGNELRLPNVITRATELPPNKDVADVSTSETPSSPPSTLTAEMPGSSATVAPSLSSETTSGNISTESIESDEGRGSALHTRHACTSHTT